MLIRSWWRGRGGKYERGGVNDDGSKKMRGNGIPNMAERTTLPYKRKNVL